MSSSQRSYWQCRLRSALRTVFHLRPKVEENGKGKYAGSIIHTVLEQHYSTPLEKRSLAAMLGTLDALVQLENRYVEMAEEMKPRIAEMLTRFYKKYGNDKIVPLSVEAKLQLPVMEGIDYLGYTDMIYEDGDNLVIEDWKTSLASIEPLSYTVLNPQIRDYCWAIRRLNPDKTVIVRYVFITPSSIKRITVPVLDTETVGAELRQLSVEQRSLPVVPNYGYHCKNCDFLPLCLANITHRNLKSVLETTYARVEGELDIMPKAVVE